MNKKRYEPFDPDLVGLAAAQMEISEFKLFQEAYQAWHGPEASEELIEPYFGRYMTSNRAPFWVRHYARTFLKNPDVLIAIAKEKKTALVTHLGAIILEFSFIMCCLYLIR
jgi:hypothetical protein